MERVKIQEIAAEVGMSNSILIEKAKELGFDVKVSTSSVDLDQAAVLMDYTMTGTLPAGFVKPSDKPEVKVKKVVKEPEPEFEPMPESEEITEETPKAKEVKEKTEVKPDTVKEETKSKVKNKKRKIQKIVAEVEEAEPEELTAPVVLAPTSAPEASPEPEEPKVEEEVPKVEKKPVKKKSSITMSSIKSTPKVSADTQEKSEEVAPVVPRRELGGRRGIKIVRKAKPAPVKANRNISLSGSGGGVPTPPKKKKPKRIAEAKDSGARMEIMGDRGLGASVELYEEEEVVLLDFSDKNIYEDMKRQEEKRKAEAKKRAAQGIGQNRQFRPQARRSIRRGGKKKKYIRLESEEKVSVISIPEDVRVYEFAEKLDVQLVK